MKGIMYADVYYSSVGVGRDGGKEKEKNLKVIWIFLNSGIKYHKFPGMYPYDEILWRSYYLSEIYISWLEHFLR